MSNSRTTPPESRDAPQSSQRPRPLGQQSSESLESTLPPTPLRDLLAAEGAGIYVFSDDATLVETVQQAGSEHYPVFPVEAWQGIVEAVERHRCGVALLDIDTVGETLERRIAELRGIGPDLVILVASPRKEAEALMGLLSDRKIHRLLIKPPALGITRLLLESSVSRFLQMRERPSDVPMHAGDADRPRRRPAAGSGRWPAWILATALVSLALGGIIVAGMSRLRAPAPAVEPVGMPAPAPAATPDAATAGTAGGPAGTGREALVPPEAGISAQPRPAQAEAEGAGGAGSAASGQSPGAPSEAGQAAAAPIDAGAPERSTPPGDPAAAASAAGPEDAAAPAAGASADRPAVDALLQQAADAVSAGRLIAPPEQSALDLYQEALRLAPAHPQASARFDVVVETVFTRAEEALLAEDAEQAATWLAALVPIRPGSSRLALLETQLERLQAALAAEAEEASAPPAVAEVAPAGELESLLTIGSARIEQGQLLAPAGDSARAYLERARLLASASPRVQAFQAELAAAVAASAEVLLDGGQLDQAESLIIEARGLGADEAEVAALDISLATAREQIARAREAAWLASAVERLDAGQWLAPANDSAIYYLEQLREQNPAHPGLVTTLERLTTALAAEAGQAIDAGDWAAAERWLAGLERAGTAPDRLAELAGRLTFERNQAEFLETPAPAGALTLVEAAPPTYPAAAVRGNIEGWVDLEFVVDRDGVPQAITVVGSEPPQRFEEAALDAVSQYRFEPFELDGQIYERRVALRVRFTLQ